MILGVAQNYVNQARNEQTCKFYAYSIHDSKTFDISHAFPPVNIAKLQKLNYSC